MGTVDTMVTILAAWTAVSVVLVVAWSILSSRQRATFVIREPRSHVVVLDGVALAPVIDLEARRRLRRSA